MRSRSILLVILFALASVLPAVTAEAALPLPTDGAVACAANVPCGYIYPRILIDLEGGNTPRDIEQGAPLAIPAVLNYIFDPCQEGFGAPEAGKPIIVQFEFPRRPRWAEMRVEPEEIEVQILPQYIVPPDDPGTMTCEYRFTADMTIHIGLVDGEMPVLRDGLQYAKLMVFAKSTESGLYKSAYGIKEVRVVPDEFIYESDLARGPAIAYVESVPQFLQAQTVTLPSMSLTLTPPEEVSLWRPARFTVTADLPAIVDVAVVDEQGRTLMNTGPQWPNLATGTASFQFNTTFFEPGRHTVLVHSQPLPAPDAAPVPRVSTAFPIHVGPFGAGGTADLPAYPDGVRFPKDYRAYVHETITEVSGNTDPQTATFQYEKFLPFPVAENANAMDLQVQLSTDNIAAEPTERGLANLMLQIIDPDGQILQQGTVDFANPTKRLTVSALPGAGIYYVRVQGVGASVDALAGATYAGTLSVIYDEKPIIRVSADGIPDAPISAAELGTPTARFGAFDVTMAATEVPAWTPQELAFDVTRDGGAFGDVGFHSVTIHDAQGVLAYASGLRPSMNAITATWTPPVPGAYTVAVRFAPGGAAVEAFQPFTVTLPLVVGDRALDAFTLPASFTFADTGYVPSFAPAGPVAFQRIDIFEGLPKVTVSGNGISTIFVDAAWAAADASPAKGSYYVVAVNEESSQARTFSYDAEAAYPGPVTVPNAHPLKARAVDPPAPANFLPGAGMGVMVLAVVALGLAMRSKQD